MTYSVFLSPIAESELLESATWYNERKENLGVEFIEEIDNAILNIQSKPLQYKIAYKNFRIALTKRFPFEIFYSVDEHNILIHHIFHASRNPKIWKNL